MTGAEYDRLRVFLRRSSGLDLGPDKTYLVESRLRPVWGGAGLRSVSELIGLATGGGRPDLAEAVVSAMATGETSFFRDKPVFDALAGTILPRLAAARSATRTLRAWSAAASTGQEAYSLAMAAGAVLPRAGHWTLSVLGTDVSRDAIDRARAGTYSQFEIQRGLPVRLMLQHFTKGANGWTVSAELKRAVEFRVFNLLERADAFGRFDLILCRNVLIYLDRRTRSAVLNRLAAALAPDGVLCLGASETVLGTTDALVPDREARGFVVRADAPRHDAAA